MNSVLGILLLCMSAGAAAQDARSAQETPVLRELRLDGASVFTRDDVLWLLNLREASPLRDSPAALAKQLQERYERDGYSEARVSAIFEEGRLTLVVAEGRIDEIEIRGVSISEGARLRERLGIQPGDIYNKRIVGRTTARLSADSGGALAIGTPRRGQPNAEGAPSDVILEHRGTRTVLVVPVRWQTSLTRITVGSASREDLFSPVDGLSPVVGFTSTLFDHASFNHTFIAAYVSYKFGRDDPGYSIGVERPLFLGPRVYVGAELHDMTASDDLWRISAFEQALVSVGFKNSFRDYYRRKGAQVFGVLRAGDHNEFAAMGRWDRHEPLANASSYSVFRDDAMYRPNPLVPDQHVNALVLGYTFDTRPLTAAGSEATYLRHLKDSLYGSSVRQRPGLRLDWTSEIAGHGLQGDAQFDRHILNARGYLALSGRTYLSVRGLFGLSNGTLPPERRFALGGIGSVHGYSFKEASGTGLTLLNAEYRVNLSPTRSDRERSAFNVFAFYDAGRITAPVVKSPAWLRGVGFGLGTGDLRVEFGFRANDIPGSRQILVRFSPTF
jgi:outer membrane protein assembly factor BamA